MSNERLLSTGELAEKVGYHANYVRLLARRDTIPASRRGSRWFFNLEEVNKALTTQNSYNGGEKNDGGDGAL